MRILNNYQKQIYKQTDSNWESFFLMISFVLVVCTLPVSLQCYRLAWSVFVFGFFLVLSENQRPAKITLKISNAFTMADKNFAKLCRCIESFVSLVFRYQFILGLAVVRWVAKWFKYCIRFALKSVFTILLYWCS